MADRLPELPLELILEILESLLALGDKVSHRTAAYLAQTCGTLRRSEAGRRARYIHARASFSLSAPQRMPVDLDHESEVLLASKWPPRVPPCIASLPEDADGLQLPHVSEAFLEGECIAVSHDRRSLLCYAAASKGKQSSQPSWDGSSAHAESLVLRSTLSPFPS